MRRFSINLATRPFYNNTLHWAAFAAAFAILAGMTWYNAARAAGIGEDLETWTARLDEHYAALSRLDNEVRAMNNSVGSMDLVELAEKSNFANEIILSRLFSWTTLFDRLEQIVPPKVRLRSIRPSIARDYIEISVDGMTPDHGALLDFEDALDRSEYFSSVYPLHESTRVKQGEINFSLTFGYHPEGRREEGSAPAPAQAEAGPAPGGDAAGLAAAGSVTPGSVTPGAPAGAGSVPPGSATPGAAASGSVVPGSPPVGASGATVAPAAPGPPAQPAGSASPRGLPSPQDLRRKAAQGVRPGGAAGKAKSKAGRTPPRPPEPPPPVEEADPNDEEDPNDDDPNDQEDEPGAIGSPPGPEARP